jgi:hypothetical protein
MRTRRFFIIFALVNIIALFVNYFEVSPRFGGDFVLTDAGKCPFGWEGDWGNHPYSQNQFWPFTDYHFAGTFRGIFADYDYVEFLAYISVIPIFLLVRRLW